MDINMKEYGGYLPLELNLSDEFYKTNCNFEVRRYNSGRGAIYQAVADSGAKRVWLPIYLCDTVQNYLHNKGIIIEFYNIDEQFMPEDINEKEDDIVVWPSYFGTVSIEKIRIVVSKYANLIIDNTQGFYVPPQEGCYNIYSCRKFFGVPDGAYLITNRFNKKYIKLGCSNSISTMKYLLDAIETSTNNAYKESLKNEERIAAEDVSGMSKVTIRILKSIDYGMVSKIRLENYSIYNEKLHKYNELQMYCPEYGPMVYPFLFKSERLRDYLVENKVYVPQWWKAVIENVSANSWERYLSRYLIPLPIDQRYDMNDIEYIANMVMKGIG